MDSVGTDDFHLPSTANHHAICEVPFTRVRPTDIKAPHTPTVVSTHQPFLITPFTLCPSISLHVFLIYLCYLLALFPVHSFIISNHTMVKTRVTNSLRHPAAPIMTNAAKAKAGIKHKQPKKKVMQKERIQQLEARINKLESGDGELSSKKPLVRFLH